jgi:hypothetical protein
MKRQHPLLSTFGIVSTTVLLVVLGLIIWRSGGKAFSPGQLTTLNREGITLEGYASHADFESQCHLCHKPLETTQNNLCVSCHTNVNVQIKVEDGTHGQIEDVNQCATCHTDHQGSNFDPTTSAYDHFDHNNTSFSLIQHQVNYDTSPLACKACHKKDGLFIVDLDSCANCHTAENSVFMLQHIQDFGGNCTDCHDGEGRMVRFEHQNTGFPLQGIHSQIMCTDCHTLANQLENHVNKDNRPLGPFKGTPRECIACHAEPAIHLDMFAPNCSECHTPTTWSPATLAGQLFDHAAQAKFTLTSHSKNFQDQPLICNDCHLGKLSSFTTESCVTCHAYNDETIAFIGEHLDQFGMDCLSCHDGIDRMNDFDHDDFFPIDGRHAEIECQDCHANQVFSGTPTECIDCHEEPSIHAGFFGLGCANCHTALAWTPARLMVHIFPLDHGGSGESECQVCHQERYIEYSCYGCHEHQDDSITKSHTEAGITREELPDCTACHMTGAIDELKQ